MSKTYFTLTKAGFMKRMDSVMNCVEKAKKDVENQHIRISAGNSKLGNIPSVSLVPVYDCANCAVCKTSCYDLRHDLIYKESKIARAINSAIFQADPERYFREIDAWLICNYPRAFRWHIGGDIKNTDYLAGMVRIAENHKDIKFLCFTKMFGVINRYVDSGKNIPDNLHIVFSGWVGQKMPNPHNFPSAHPPFDGGVTSAHDGAMLCTGNCSECLREDKLCWALKPGEEILFPVH